MCDAFMDVDFVSSIILPSHACSMHSWVSKMHSWVSKAEEDRSNKCRLRRLSIPDYEYGIKSFTYLERRTVTFCATVRGFSEEQ